MRLVIAGFTLAILGSGQVNDPGTVISSSVHMVESTLIVTDGRGQHISGLQPADIQLFDNGVRQRVALCFWSSTGVLLLRAPCVRPVSLAITPPPRQAKALRPR